VRQIGIRIAALIALAVTCLIPAAQAAPEKRHERPGHPAVQHHHTHTTHGRAHVHRAKPKPKPAKAHRAKPKPAKTSKRQHPRTHRVKRPKPTLGQKAAKLARRYLGIPYAWGGASPSQGFDCSGLVMYVYSKLGISLPHHAASQYRYGHNVPYSRLKPGDLVFFSGLGHVGLYVGAGRFIDAPHSGTVVRVTSLGSRASSFYGARRLT
jgi:cell wall-associated NlpC family hydrolase